MDRIEFFKKLKQHGKEYRKEDLDDLIKYYDEMISDRMDQGEKEEDIIRSFSIEEILDTLPKVDVDEGKNFKSEEMTGIDSLEIDLNSNILNVRSWDGESIKISYHEYTGQKFNSKKEGSQWTFKSKKMNLAEWFIYNVTFGYLRYKNEVSVLLPSTFAGDLKLNVDNGKIHINKAMAANANIRAGNGSMYVNEMTAKEMECVSNNGKIHLSRVDAAAIRCRTDNGRILLGDMNVSGKGYFKTNNGSLTGKGKLYIFENEMESLNGTIDLCSAKGESVHFKTANGRIGAAYLDYVEIVAENLNGSIRLLAKGEEDNYAIDASSVNGKSEIGEESIRGRFVRKGNGTRKMRLKTCNGSVRVKFSYESIDERK